MGNTHSRNYSLLQPPNHGFPVVNHLINPVQRSPTWQTKLELKLAYPGHFPGQPYIGARVYESATAPECEHMGCTTANDAYALLEPSSNPNLRTIAAFQAESRSPLGHLRLPAPIAYHGPHRRLPGESHPRMSLGGSNACQGSTRQLPELAGSVPGITHGKRCGQKTLTCKGWSHNGHRSASPGRAAMLVHAREGDILEGKFLALAHVL